MTTETIDDRDRPAYQRPQDGLWVISREEFARERFDYKPGQHVVFAGPTQRAGKTTLAFKLLEYCATTDLPAYVAVSKPTDKATARMGARLGYRRTEQWPIPPKFQEMWNGKPTGYLIWPDMRNPDTAMIKCEELTRELIRWAYSQGAKGKQCILVLDDTVTKSKVLHLDGEMVMIITMAGAMGIGGWFFIQKPTDAGRAALWSYPNAEKVFISKDPEKRNRVRYNEIGGFDSDQVYNATQYLTSYQFLYLERSHGYMCVVDSR
jgi:hypothetical protein